MSSDLEARVAALEDIEAVRVLMADYHRACDGWTDQGTHRDPEAIADLFTPDGVWAVTAVTPPPTGRAQIVELAHRLQTIPWIVHVVLNPVVVVTGDDATGEFKGMIRVRLGTAGRAVWSLGRYRLVARRTEAGWRIATLDWEPFEAGGLYQPPG